VMCVIMLLAMCISCMVMNVTFNVLHQSDAARSVITCQLYMILQYQFLLLLLLFFVHWRVKVAIKTRTGYNSLE